MARYIHGKSGVEYGTGLLIFAFFTVAILGLVGAGAIAAIPALFGAVDGAMWVWGILGGIWTGSTLLAALSYRKESRKLER